MHGISTISTLPCGKAEAAAHCQQGLCERTKRVQPSVPLGKGPTPAEYERASARWDAVKSNPYANGYLASFKDAKLPADHTQARAELDAAIRAADAAYHAEVAR